MMKWTVEFTKAADNDLNALDGSQRKQVLSAINKVPENPLPKNEE